MISSSDSNASQSRFLFFSPENFPEVSIHSFTAKFCLASVASLKLVASSTKKIDLKAFLAKQAGFSWDPKAATFYGVISKMSCRSTPSLFAVEIVIHSPLIELSFKKNSRVFRNQTLIQICQTIFSNYQMPVKNLTRKNNGEISFIVQYQQSDFDFLSCLLSQYGAYLASFSEGNLTRIAIADNLPLVADHTELALQANTGLVVDTAVIFRMSRCAMLMPQWIRLLERNEQTPTQLQQAEIKSEMAPYTVGDESYTEQLETSDVAKRKAILLQHYYDTMRLQIIAWTTCPTLQLGQTLTIKEKSISSVNYFITGIEHFGSELVSENSDSCMPRYYNKIFLLESNKIFCLKPKAFPIFHGVLPAMVEGYADGKPLLDEEGRYKIRLLFEKEDEAAKKNTHKISRLQPFSGMKKENALGLHFPLKHLTPVLLTPLHGNLNQALLLGAMNNREALNPVTLNNHSQHLLKTQSGQQWLCDDDPKKSSFLFSNQAAAFSMCADKGKPVTALSSTADVSLFAHKNLNVDVNEIHHSHTQNFQQHTEKNYYLISRKGIEQNSARDFIQQISGDCYSSTDKNSIILVAKQNINLKTGVFSIKSEQAHLVFSTDDTISFYVNQIKGSAKQFLFNSTACFVKANEMGITLCAKRINFHTLTITVYGKNALINPSD